MVGNLHKLHRKHALGKFGVVALLSVVACFPGYTYAPVTTSSAVLSGRPAAAYSFTEPGAGAPLAGEIRLATLGFVKVHRQGDPPGADLRALRVQILLINTGDRPWVLDPLET